MSAAFRWLDRHRGSSDNPGMPHLQTPGARLMYRRAGSGPPVLLIQGAGVVGEGWKPQTDGLSNRFTLVAFDNRGIGGSEILDGRLSIEDMAADALALADGLGLEAFHVVGHSMGGLIAQELALSTSGRVKSLAFLCTFASGRQALRLTAAMALTTVRMRVGTRAMRRSAFTELVMPAAYLQQVDRRALAERLRPLFGRDLADQPPIIMKQVRAMSRYDAGSRLSALAPIPSLVVSAALDRIALPEYGRALAAAIPGSRYVELADAGHGVTIQCPQAINDLLAGHFVASDSSVVC